MKRFIIPSLLILSLSLSAQQKKLELTDIYGKGSLLPKAVPGFRSMADGIHYSNTVSEDGKSLIVKYTFEKGNATDTIRPSLAFSDYQFSADEKSLLLKTNEEQVYRHSTRAEFYIYNLASGKLTPLSDGGKQMYATFSPDGKKVAFIRDNNLYIKDLESGSEKAVTTDGKKNAIINGATDWVYEEEFTMDKAYQWNNDASAIAFYKFDESDVKEFNLTYYDDLYPREEKYKYPKAGETNSKADIYVYHLSTGRTVKMETGTDREYIPRIKWTQDPSVLSIQTMNRHQNVLNLLFCNAETGSSKVILTEKNNSFIEITDDLTFLSNGKQFIWTSTRSGFNHIYLHSISGSMEKQITSGNYDVMKYYGFNEKTGEFFYQSAEPSPMERRVNVISLKGKKTVLTTDAGTNLASFSNNFSYFVNTWSSYGKPYICTVRNHRGQVMRMLEDNSGISKSLNEYALSNVESLSVKNKDGISLNGWMIKPPDFSESKKYPVLFFVYGGPGKQTVANSWGGSDFLWHQMLSQKGYIIVSFDNRGTKGRGIEFSNSIHRNLGKYEVEDQLAMAKHIQSLPYADKDRIGVWGWSYGGYMTSLLLSKGNGLYKCGIAVAPVTNWRFYDSIYTERYLQTPQENPQGYDENSPINFSKDLKGKFLVVHGSADDNVHMQNTMEFVTSLVNAGIEFDMFIYPDKSHSISGTATRYHLFNKMTNFILENL